ncbi:MAG: cryptochrome/photolyase family protein [Ferruginibacter sp.]
MNEVSIIFPHQLFKSIAALPKSTTVFLLEEFLFFKHYNFHKQKLVLHRASLKSYQVYLKKQGYTVEYIESTDNRNDIRKLIAHLKTENIKIIHVTEVVDDWLNKRMTSACAENNIKIVQYQTPAFLNSKQEGDYFFNGRKRYFQTDFYIAQRKKRNILLAADDGPFGGQWSYDADNRKKYPAKENPPQINCPKEDEYVIEAKQYINSHFKQNYGVIESFFYPVNFDAAEKWLEEFLQTRFEKFGDYEDAIVASENFLHHAVISPLINIGLLTPQQVLDAVLAYAAKKNSPLNSTEGFIRQIIGWREFIRIVYEREGAKQRTTNYWKFARKMPPSFWDGTTGIEPIDNTIKKALTTGYLHHIERLMLLGNFMLLCEFDPEEVYKWFMEMFVDSYDWVMVPNVYGMVQFADGGLMTTKPYISGSNYVLKMSDYKKGPWCEIWDGLFWRFMDVHRTFFKKNPRLGMLVNTFDKMAPEKRNAHNEIAEKFLSSLDI